MQLLLLHILLIIFKLLTITSHLILYFIKFLHKAINLFREIFDVITRFIEFFFFLLSLFQSFRDTSINGNSKFFFNRYNHLTMDLKLGSIVFFFLFIFCDCFRYFLSKLLVLLEFFSLFSLLTFKFNCNFFHLFLKILS